MAGDVKFQFTGDSSQLRSELKKVEKNLNKVAGGVQGMTNKARKGLDGLGKNVAASGKAAQQAANNNQNFNRTLGNVKDSAGETASIMGGLATSLSVISPQAGAAVRALGDLATGVEAASRGGSRLFAILGPVGVAVAALGAAYVAIKGDLDDANEALEVQRDRLEGVANMARQVKEAVLIAAHAELQAAQATGKATQAQVDAAAAALDELAIAQKTQDMFGARREALTAERDAIEAKIAAQKESTAETKTAQLSTSLLVQAHGAGTQAAKDATQATAAEAAQLKALQNQLKNAETQLSVLDTTQTRYQEALKSTKEAQKELTKTTKAGTETEKKQAEALKATSDALGFLRDKTQAAFVSQLSERHKILHAYQQEVDAIEEVAAKHTENAEIQRAADAALHNSRVVAMAELDALDEQNAQEKMRRQDEVREKEMQILSSSLGGLSSLAASTADAYQLSAESRTKAERDAAMRAFKTQKALSMTAVSLSFAEALMAAFKSGNPVMTGIQTAAATAAFGVSVGRINAQEPSFHSGTGLVRAPSGVSEMNATLRGGEAVSTPLGAELIGRSNIERANAGVPPGGGGRPIAFQYEHRVFSQFIRDNVRTQGPLGIEQDRKIRVGHRRS